MDGVHELPPPTLGTRRTAPHLDGDALCQSTDRPCYEHKLVAIARHCDNRYVGCALLAAVHCMVQRAAHVLQIPLRPPLP